MRIDLGFKHPRLGLVLLIASVATAQTPASRSAQDPFEQKVTGITLDQQSVTDGVAKLSQSTNIAYSIEFQLGTTISAPAPALAQVSGQAGPGSISEVLGQLCRIDPTFTWKRIGNTANILPRELQDTPSYLLNRILPTLSLRNVTDAEQAIFQTVEQLPGHREQIAVLQSGISLAFPEPYSATFHDITVREAFDRIAQQLGHTYGWQFGGATDFRVISFHNRLATRPRPPVQQSGK